MKPEIDNVQRDSECGEPIKCNKIRRSVRVGKELKKSKDLYCTQRRGRSVCYAKSHLITAQYVACNC